MAEVINYWFSYIQHIVGSFFGYTIVDGVTFGGFILGCFILAILIRFTYTRIVR